MFIDGDAVVLGDLQANTLPPLHAPSFYHFPFPSSCSPITFAPPSPLSLVTRLFAPLSLSDCPVFLGHRLHGVQAQSPGEFTLQL
jgi:hypothetical protein